MKLSEHKEFLEERLQALGDARHNTCCAHIRKPKIAKILNEIFTKFNIDITVENNTAMEHYQQFKKLILNENSLTDKDKIKFSRLL